MEKHTSYCAMMKLGLPVPETWMLPPKAGPDHEDSDRMLRSYGQLFDLNRVGEAVGYPNFIKPYDGGGWRGACANAHTTCPPANITLKLSY